MTESTNQPLTGLWKPRPLQALYYGESCVSKNLLSLLPSENSKAFIITGSSLANKTPLVKQVEELLGSKHHAGTFSNIKQHAPVAQLDEATDLVAKDPNIDTIISLGGGSPIDSSKAISHRLHEKTNKYLFHISIPTTLSAAECTTLAGYTKEDGLKAVIGNVDDVAIAAILYDPSFAAHTPKRLWISTGMRALDHAMELMYHPSSSEIPCKAMALTSASTLFHLLPKAAESHPDDPDVSIRLYLAAYGSLGFLGQAFKGGLGLSHSLGYALGSPYGIPHGETSCLTLGHVVKLKAKASKDDAAQIARMLPGLGGQSTGDVQEDAQKVGDMILDLVKRLGLDKSLTERGVGKDQLAIITERATGGQKEGKQYDAVKSLVEGLY